MDQHSSVLSSANVFACFLRKLLPPFLEGLDVNSCDAVPFHRVAILGTRRRKLLCESKDVCSKLGLLQDLNAHFRLFDLGFQPLLSVNAGNSDELAFHCDILAANFERRNSEPPSLNSDLDILLYRLHSSGHSSHPWSGM